MNAIASLSTHAQAFANNATQLIAAIKQKQQKLIVSNNDWRNSIQYLQAVLGSRGASSCCVSLPPVDYECNCNWPCCND